MLLQKYNKDEFIKPIGKEIFKKIPLFVLLISLLSSISLFLLNQYDSLFVDYFCLAIEIITIFIALFYPYFEIKELNILRKLALLIKIDLLNYIFAFLFLPLIWLYEIIFKKNDRILISLTILGIMVILLIVFFFLWYGVRRLERIKYNVKTSIKILSKEFCFIFKRFYYYFAIFFIPIGAGYLLYFFYNTLLLEFYIDNKLTMFWVPNFIRNVIIFTSHFGNGAIYFFVAYLYIYISQRYFINLYHNAEKIK